jgi:U3 small nucleolar RNA-associated protein 20
MISSRIVGEQLQKHDPIDILSKDSDLSFVTGRKGSLYDLASNFCSHLDEEESNMSTELSELAIKSLTWLARAMDSNPGLCYATGDAEGKQPVKWLLTRLANIARRKGTLRRKAIFKCFAALCHGGGAEMISPYLDVIIEPMHRAMIEAAGAKNHLGTEKFSSESELAKEVLSMLEEGCDADYLPALAKVKLKARERRDQRKDDIAAEKISDPAAAAKKKIEKQISEKERRKRRVQGHRGDRGATAKRQHV